MSLRYEQHRALKKARELLRDLLDPKATPRVPKWIRKRAGDALKHYPFLHESGEPMFSRDEFTVDVEVEE